MKEKKIVITVPDCMTKDMVYAALWAGCWDVIADMEKHNRGTDSVKLAFDRCQWAVVDKFEYNKAISTDCNL